mgnify:CR=1 FL=1
MTVRAVPPVLLVPVLPVPREIDTGREMIMETALTLYIPSAKRVASAEELSRAYPSTLYRVSLTLKLSLSLRRKSIVYWFPDEETLVEVDARAAAPCVSVSEKVFVLLVQRIFKESWG